MIPSKIWTLPDADPGVGNQEREKKRVLPWENASRKQEEPIENIFYTHSHTHTLTERERHAPLLPPPESSIESFWTQLARNKRVK